MFQDLKVIRANKVFLEWRVFQDLKVPKVTQDHKEQEVPKETGVKWECRDFLE